MKYRKTYYRITLIAWSTIAAIFVLCFIAPPTAGANALFKARIDNSIDGVFSFDDLNGDGNQDMVSPWGDENH
jgi:hypothetical protein